MDWTRTGRVARAPPRSRLPWRRGVRLAAGIEHAIGFGADDLGGDHRP